jgi:4-amino-4-deoxy-L-arabinose transferase-like glycosyltransferase
LDRRTPAIRSRLAARWPFSSASPGSPPPALAVTSTPAAAGASTAPRHLDGAIALAQRHADLLIVLSLTLLAALVRFWALGDVPQGVHGDEAQYGDDGQRVLDSGWIGPYTTSALGQPSGIAYVTAIGQALFGATALGARFGVTLVAVAAVPLCYALFRLLSTRVIATIAALLLATSLWHVHFSRVAYQPGLVPTFELATLLLWTLALQRGQWYWFVAAGAMLGLGLYTYNVYPIFVIAFALWVAVYTLLFKRRELSVWTGNVGLAVVAAVIVGLPLFLYMADQNNDYFNHYRGYYQQYSVLQSDAFEEANLGGKVEIVTGQAERFVGAYVWEGITDFVDGAAPEREPMLDIITVVLFVLGVRYAAWRWRETPHLMALILVVIIPLTTVLQTNAIYRGPLGAVPFVCFLAALPLALAWQQAPRLREVYRPLVHGGVALMVAAIAFMNLNTYRSWADSSLFPWVYTQQISAASEYVEALPEPAYVYFYSSRWSFNYETRQYLAPDATGEDRSREFASRLDPAMSFVFDRSRPGLILLLPPYTQQIDELQRLYPDGRRFDRREDGETLFIAYHLPAR